MWPLGEDSSQTQLRLYWVWSEPVLSRLVAVSRYSWIDEREHFPGITSRRSHIVSQQATWHASASLDLAGRVLARRQDDTIADTTRWTGLVAGRATRSLGGRWRASVQAAQVAHPLGAGRQVLGADLGYRLSNAVDLVVGWNVRGIDDAQLEAEDEFSRRVYVRLRYSFDGALQRWR